MSQASSAWDQIAARNSCAESADTDATVPAILVSDTPPTATQRRAAWGIVAFLGVVFAMATPFYDVNLAVVPAFVPVVHAVVCMAGLIAAAFLFSQYAVQPQPAFLALASGYMSAGLFAFFQSLAFPNAYSATGLLGGDPSTAAWLFVMWRTSFPLGVLAYLLTRRSVTPGATDHAASVPIAMTIVCTVIGACCLTRIVTAMGQHLPLLFTDATHEALHAHVVTIPAILLSLAAIVLLLARRRTTLDLWLIVTLIAALPDIVVPVSRYALGFYVSRSYELVSGCAVLIALLTEASTLYGRLASARALQAHGEEERFSSVEATTATVAHELRQPLSAIRIHASTGARLLEGPDPALAHVAEILNDIEKDAKRAGDVIDRIRSAVRRQKLSMEVLDINTVVSDVARLASDDASARRVVIVTSLSSECFRVKGDRTQITQVLLNLIANGMNAMEEVPVAQRQLTLRTAKREGTTVVTVSDRGCGISQETMPHLFESFFTTRTGGMGLGLSIAHSIVLAHQGRMWAENDPNGGAIFHFSLPPWEGEPIGSVESPADQAA